MRDARYRIVVLRPDDWRVWKELRLQALAEAPHAFSSTLAEWQDAGEGRWRERLCSVPFNAIALLDGKPAGMVSGTALDDRASTTLISMWVAPFARGAGIGDALVLSVLEWAAAHGARHVELDVMAANAHAIALYHRQGFTFTETPADSPCERRMIRSL